MKPDDPSASMNSPVYGWPSKFTVRVFNLREVMTECGHNKLFNIHNI